MSSDIIYTRAGWVSPAESSPPTPTPQPDGPAPSPWRAEITVLTKEGGPFSKRIALVNGRPKGDTSACTMSNGIAQRVIIDSPQSLADLINGFTPNQAYMTSVLRPGILDRARVLTKEKLNGANDPSIIARSNEFLSFKKDATGIVLFDTDIKAAPDTVMRRIEECGGVRAVLCEVLPELKNVARVERASTSSGLRNVETGEEYPGSGGSHTAAPVNNAADIPRVLSVLFDRAWLKGYGWGMVSGSGAFLPRSIIDLAMAVPTQPVFEGKPVVEPPLEQIGRNAVAYDGDILDTRLCVPLSDAEKIEVQKLKAAEEQRLLPERKVAREKWIAARAEALIAKGMPEAEARKLAEGWLTKRELTGDFPLPFDDPIIAGTTVVQVIAEPDKFIKKSMGDPFEPEYGTGKAKLFRRRNGSLIIVSLAHGQKKIYNLQATIITVPDNFSPGNNGVWGDGVWYYPEPTKKNPEPPAIKITGPFTIDAHTSDDAHDNHGLLVKWRDRVSGAPHQWAIPMSMVHGDGGAIASALAKAGLYCNPRRGAHDLLKVFIGGVQIKRQKRSVNRAGWHNNLFVMPDGRVFGADSSSVVMQSEIAINTGRYAKRGTLKEWQDNIASHATKNYLLALALSSSFLSPLLRILNQPSRGGNLYGKSQSGKTTLVRAYISVNGPAEEEFIRQWRATVNGLEAVAAETNDLGLHFDELSQADGRDASQAIYMIANSSGKQRANRVGAARLPYSWLTFFWSTAEFMLASKLAEIGQRTRAGQDVRMIEINADALCGFGVWEDLCGFDSGAEFSNHLREMSCTYCGTAGPAFLDRLARDRLDNPALLIETFRKVRQKFFEAYLPKDADGQVQSVATLLALMGGAGELATSYDVLSWDNGIGLNAAGVAFKRWLGDRGGSGAGEDIRAFDAVRGFLAAHGNARFEEVVEDEQNTKNDDSGENGERAQRIYNRAGFKVKDENDAWEYWILPDCWKAEVCKGLDPTKAAKALKQQGLLIPDKDGKHLSCPRWCGKQHGTIRVYVIRGRILRDDKIPGDDQ